MRSLRPLAFALGLAFAGVASTPALAQNPAPAPVRMLLVDMQRAVWENEEGLRAQAVLRILVDQQTAQLDAKQRALQAAQKKLQDAMQSKAAPEVVQPLAVEYEKLGKDLMAFQQTAALDRQKLEEKLISPVVAKVNGIVQGIMKNEGYTLVIERRFAHYAKSELDLTDRVIRAYNLELAKKPAASKPAAKSP